MMRHVIACSDPEYVGREVSRKLLCELMDAHGYHYCMKRCVFTFRKNTWRPELGVTTQDYMEVSWLSFEKGMQRLERILVSETK